MTIFFLKCLQLIWGLCKLHVPCSTWKFYGRILWPFSRQKQLRAKFWGLISEQDRTKTHELKRSVGWYMYMYKKKHHETHSETTYQAIWSAYLVLRSPWWRIDDYFRKSADQWCSSLRGRRQFCLRDWFFFCLESGNYFRYYMKSFLSYLCTWISSTTIYFS